MRHAASLLFVIVLSSLPACGSGPSSSQPPEHGGADTAPSCATISCPGNQACVDRAEGPSCACTVMAMCVEGHTWDDERCECVPTTSAGDPTTSGPTSTAACATDDECRAEDNYCGGCHCLALGPGQSAPACDDPVQCVAQPCGVTEGEPACVDGRCVLR